MHSSVISLLVTVPHSAQDSIPFQRMFPDGICRVTDNYYTKTIQFQDINYQLAQQEDQTAIFEEWCSFLNFFDSSIRFDRQMPAQQLFHRKRCQSGRMYPSMQMEICGHGRVQTWGISAGV